jgi:tripartite-type tricarboxylate transporter receptor subunit TctC
MISGSFVRLSIRTVLCALGFAAMLATVRAHAETYPARPIRIVAPTAPGGPVDVLARLTGDRLAQALGQPVVIENRPGAGSVVGSKAVAGASPDGYTLLFGASSSLAVTPALYKNAGYDPVKSFTPVASVSQGELVLAVTPSLPVKSVSDLVAYAKTNPGKLNYGAALGNTPHVAWGMFKLQTGTDIVYVPYQGAVPAISDLIAGRMHMIVDAPGVLLGHVAEGKLRALAVTSPKRSANAPELPTMVESGYPDFLITFWTGLVAPAGTPEPVVARLNAAVNEGLRSIEMRQRLAQFQVEPLVGSSQDFGAFIASEAKKWAAVIQAAGIKAE